MPSLRAALTVGFLLVGTPLAFAADPAPAGDAGAIVAPGAYVPGTYTWAGPYAGAFVGYNFTEFDSAAGANSDGEGFVGGVYTGFNFQRDSFVYGVEADIGGGDVSGSGVVGPLGATLGTDTGVFGSLRGRVGYAADPFMVFATGGVAAADNELSLGGASDDNTHFGWTVGAGVEASVTDNLRSRIEYRFTDYESEDYNLGSVTTSSGFDEHSIRAGLALQF